MGLARWAPLKSAARFPYPIRDRVGTTRARRIAMSVLVRFAPMSVTTTEQYDETIRRL
jgi:hypothetical protein